MSNNPQFHNINININTTNTTMNNSSNIHINVEKKKKGDKTKLPELKGTTNYIEKTRLNQGNSDESDGEHNLPPIGKDPNFSKQYYYSYNRKNKGLALPIADNTSSYVPIAKKMNEHKKNYVSPYSQKAIIASKNPRLTEKYD